MPGPCDLSDLAQTAVAELEPSARERVELVAHGDLAGTWDADRMLQILANLTRNAALHGDPRGPIRIELDGRSSETVLVVVHNHGHIPPERLGRLFDPFKRAVDRYRRGDGLGLGLYIVDQLVRAHGGRVQVDSQPSTGTRFLVDLPRSAG